MAKISKETGLVITNKSSSSVEKLGYIQTDLKDEYIVEIIDKRPEVYVKKAGGSRIIIIRAPMQEQITTATESSWSPLAASSYLSTFKELSQLLTGRSLVSKYTSRNFWSGTTPMNFTLNLKFQAINDTEQEVLYPIIELQRMSLPFSGHGEDATSAGEFFANTFLAAPGPDPYTIGGKSIRGRLGLGGYFPAIYEDITVKIGKLLTLRKVVVKSIQIQTPPKFTQSGAPIEANATIQFQTFEIQTKESLDGIYNRTPGKIAIERAAAAAEVWVSQ